MYNFLCQILLNIFKYILFIEKIETFWSKDVIDIWVLPHFEFKTNKDFMCKVVLNIFKYILWDIYSQKGRKERTLNYVKMTLYSQ